MYNYLQRDISEFAKENPNSGNLLLTWELYGKVLEEIIDDMCHCNFDYVYGLPRGGLIPAVSVSHSMKSVWSFGTLKTEMITSEEELLQKADERKSHILLIDDILDSGKQMKELIGKLKTKCGDAIDIKVCSIVYNEKTSSVNPDYYGFNNENGGWIDFPWECVK